MEQLIEKMHKLQASSFALYLKAHLFHWNVEGQDFHQYHDFFGDFYNEIWGSVDTTAEQIRALGAKAKGSLTEYKELSVVRDQMTQLTIQEMNASLYRDNEAVIAILNDVHAEAEKQRTYGLLNYIEGRIDTHKKHSWMLSASMEKQPVKESVEPASITEEVKTYIFHPKDL
jgi:starvation-inducible DNA-binding protein